MMGILTIGKKELCKECKTKTYRKILGKDKNEDYGFIVIHKKGCAYLKKIMKNSVEV